MYKRQAHWFGTDDMGRDILSRILYGARYSMGMGILAVIFGMFFGCIVAVSYTHLDVYKRQDLRQAA